LEWAPDLAAGGGGAVFLRLGAADRASCIMGLPGALSSFTPG